MDLTTGSRWQSAVDSAEVVIVRAPSSAVELQCGGHPMVPIGEARPGGLEPAAEWQGGAPLGKRYVHSGSELEVLVVKAGAASLAVDGEAMELKGAKPVPASD